MKPSSSSSIVINARITEGLKESSLFTHIPWVREQFISKLGIDPHPGIINLEVIDARDLERFGGIKKRKGVKIIPAEPGFCSARCFHVLVCWKIKGALIIPQVVHYPECKIEIISPEKIRDVLSLKRPAISCTEKFSQ